MAKEPNEFDIGTADELQRRNGWYAKNWEPPDIDPANVPADLRHLIPLAQRWGITCDITRHDAGSHATERELIALREELRGTHARYEDWAFGATNEFGAETTERWVFGALYLFEAEECDGPGIRSKLDWAISRFQNSPDATNREWLQSALDSVIVKGRRFIRPRQASIDIAQKLLLQANELPSLD